MSGAATLDLVRQSGSGRAPVVWTDGERWAVTRDRADDAAMRRRGWRDTIGREMTVPATLGRQISTLPSGVYAVDDDRVTHVGPVAGLEGGRGVSEQAATGGAVDVERVARAVNRYAQAWQDAGYHSADDIPDREFDRVWGDPLDAARQGLADALGVPVRDLLRWLL